jgi:hypothetical protein
MRDTLPMHEHFENHNAGADAFAMKFPGPITLVAARLKWWAMIILCGGMAAVGIFLAIFVWVHPTRVKGDAQDVQIAVEALAFCAIFFGLCTVASVIALRRGSLRLDEYGF